MRVCRKESGLRGFFGGELIQISTVTMKTNRWGGDDHQNANYYLTLLSIFTTHIHTHTQKYN